MASELVPVLPACELREGQRANKTIAGRTVTFVRHNSRVLCFDSLCYHFGGPLHQGVVQDIEEDQTTITCPWHHHRIDLGTGAAAAPGCPPTTSCQTQQAVFSVKEHDGQIWLDAAALSVMAASNKYNLSTRLEDKRPRGGYGLAQGLSMSQGIPAQAHKADARTAEASGQIAFPERKQFQLRAAAARAAVANKKRPLPPAVASPATPATPPPQAQRTLFHTKLFTGHSPAQQTHEAMDLD